MEQLAKLQKQYVFFKDLLKSLESEESTPDNDFAKKKCRENLEKLDKIFDRIDYMTQVVYD